MNDKNIFSSNNRNNFSVSRENYKNYNKIPSINKKVRKNINQVNNTRINLKSTVTKKK